MRPQRIEAEVPQEIVASALIATLKVNKKMRALLRFWVFVTRNYAIMRVEIDEATKFWACTYCQEKANHKKDLKHKPTCKWGQSLLLSNWSLDWETC